MQQITNVSTGILKVHPRNQEFYDDIEGDPYKKFKKSIQEDGILTPLIVSTDMTIISGHQRFKASKDLDIEIVPVIIREDLNTEEEKLKKLLATNFGRLKNNPVKQGKVYSEYERLCGIRQGSSSLKGSVVGDKMSLTQNDIAKELGVDVRTIQRLKKLQTLSPDLQQLIEDGSVKYTTALNVFSKLSNDEQEQLLNEIGQDKIKEMTSRQVQQYIQEKQELEKSFNELSQKYDNEKSKSKEKEIIEKVVEVDNTDYAIAKKYRELKEQHDELVIEKNRAETRLRLMTDKAEAYKQDSKDYSQIKEEITYLTKQKDDIGRRIKSVTDISGLVVEIDHMLKGKLAPVKYSKSLLEAKDDEIVIENLTNIVNNVQSWVDEMKQYIPNKINYVEVI